jgi:CelD/BcsL family acetyltransferase involved in cellulose biosynthesis
MELLVAALAEQGALHLALPGVPVDDPYAAAFLRAADRRSVCRRLTPYRRSPIVDTTGTYADWRAETRPRWRTDIERLRRKMERDHDAEIVILARPDDLDAQLDACWEVERRGWKGEQGTAIAASKATTDFYRRVAHAFAERDELRLSWIKLDGELVAFDYLLLSYGRLWGLKTGFDPAHRRLAPGFVLRLGLIERCFQEPIDALEMLGDADEWKMRFATEVRDHRVVETCPRRSATALSWTARDRVRPLARATRTEIRGRLPQRVLDLARSR